MSIDVELTVSPLCKTWWIKATDSSDYKKKIK